MNPLPHENTGIMECFKRVQIWTLYPTKAYGTTSGNLTYPLKACPSEGWGQQCSQWSSWAQFWPGSGPRARNNQHEQGFSSILRIRVVTLRPSSLDSSFLRFAMILLLMCYLDLSYCAAINYAHWQNAKCKELWRDLPCKNNAIVEEFKCAQIWSLYLTSVAILAQGIWVQAHSVCPG